MTKEVKKHLPKRLATFQPQPFKLDDWRKTAQMLDTDFELLEVQFRQGIKSEYACMRCRDLTTNKEFGLNCGGIAVVKKIREGLSRTTLPLILQIFDTGEYYDIK
jgi:hypothetical protein